MVNLSDYFGQNIDQKRIVITGGTTGIGRTTAELLASLGGHVFIFGRDTDDFDQACQTIKAAARGKVFGITADIAYMDDVETIWKEIDKTLGGVDILINNAAVPADGIMEEDNENIRYIVDTNIIGYISFAKEAASRMKAQSSGHIINIGSMSAETREETGTVYVATKSAIRGFTAALRKEINGHGIKVSLIEPGAVSSDMQPAPKEQQRQKVKKLEMLDADDIAASIVFCLSQPRRCDVVTIQVRPHLQLI